MGNFGAHLLCWLSKFHLFFFCISCEQKSISSCYILILFYVFCFFTCNPYIRNSCRAECPFCLQVKDHSIFDRKSGIMQRP
uniref:Secreted protein n=1 Tax=Ixodes ricinus TaxID=34613 RepID=A0A0K8R6E1_IXORI